MTEAPSEPDAPRTEVPEQPPADASQPRGPDAQTYWLARFAILRLLGLIYFIAFLVFINQGIPLLGANGLLPVPAFLDRVGHHFGTPWQSFLNLPTLFWLKASDGFLLGVAWSGALLALLVLLGFANAPMLVILWFLYLSIHHIGQLSAATSRSSMPPRFLRAQLYRYQFAPLRERAWWTRTLIGPWLPALSSEDPRLGQFLESYGWLSSDSSGSR